MISLSLLRGRLRPLLASAAVIGTLALAGCQTDGIDMAKAMKPIPPETVALMESKGMDKHAPILVRLFKEEAELEVWKQNRDGQYAILKTYPICRWSGELGPKVREGDRQAPEGFYTITPAQMNPRSQYYLSFNLGYPNAFDRSLGRTGSQLMVHGDCSSRGCYSMTDEQIAEIYALGRESFFGGQKTFQVQAYPFRMTALNMAKHRNSPHLAFWKMLKEGNDHFEVARAEPKVDVCERHYVFNAEERPGSGPLRFNPAGPCPAYQVAPELAAEVSAKTKRDELAFADFSRRGTPTVPIKVGQDGGMHPSFVAALNPQQVRDDSGNVRWMVDSPPIGTRIPTVAVASADAGTLPVSTGAAPSAPMAANVPMPRPAPRRAVRSYASTGSIPSSSSAYASPAASSGSSGMMNGILAAPGKAASSVARVFGFGKDDEPKTASTTPGRSAPVRSVARRSEPARPAAKPKPAPAQTAAPAPKQAATTDNRSADARPATTTGGSTAMSGAQPVLPAGGFDTRWPSSFR